MKAARLAFAILAPGLLGGAGQQAKPSSSAVARATARIHQPVIVRSGKAPQGQQAQILRARERKCAPGDAPAGVACLLIVTDVE